MNEQNLPAPGRFRGKVTEHDLGRASTGNIQVAIGFAYEDNDGVAQRVVYYGSFTKKSIDSEYGVLYALRNLGFDMAEQGFSDTAFAALAARTKENPGGGALVGREADITVEHEEFDGKVRAKVAWVNAPGGGLMKERLEGASEVKNAAAQIRSLLGGGGGPAPSMGSQGARPVAPRPAAAPSGSRDLPF